MKIKTLFSKPTKWTRGTYARRGNVQVDPFSARATKWCLLGAVTRCYGSSVRGERVLHKIVTEIGLGVAQWNDDATFAQVKELVTRLDI